ncbi:MAG: D-tyrosyl-tRNA(Tyr) deacylase [Anaerolineaceae bacterium]|nr:D-tyrosyl-tRNA(Tyr) deacylase [Anaerolineaceae bacterium]MBN2678373.1 D-tyrosyl-tRNA(Tyr) deacylase [Anaerolineaceae bacterium]
MKALIQRVCSGRVEVDGKTIASIGKGMVILVGIGHQDTITQVQAIADKVVNLRIFEDGAGKMNLSILDTCGDILLVSQFTLYADTHKGRRPAFTEAAAPEMAKTLVDDFSQELITRGVTTQTGEFGAHMVVNIVNDGPVTILLEQ